MIILCFVGHHFAPKCCQYHFTDNSSVRSTKLHTSNHNTKMENEKGMKHDDIYFPISISWITNTMYLNGVSLCGSYVLGIIAIDGKN